MLQSIRDRLTGPIVWFVIGLIAIPFAFWGIDSFNTGGGDPVVVKVGDQKITQAQFKQAYDQRYQQYRELLGEGFRPDLFDEKRFRQLTLDSVVQDSALRQFASSSGYRASDATLRDYLVSIPAFQKDGKFSAETYRELLQRQNLPTDRYESQLRESLVIDQVRSAVQETAFVTDSDAWQAHRLEKQTRQVTSVPVLAKNFEAQVQVSDAQIAERYESEKDRYLSPERLRLAYVQLDRGKLAPAEAPAAEILKAVYEAEKDARFSSAEERKASHILVAFGADKDAAKKKAEDILAQVKVGGNFAVLAQANSEDAGSKTKGGDLGWIRKGMMVPNFETAVFGMTAGDVTGPVETEFGWHVIRLDEIKAAALREFDAADVQAELLEAYRTREGEKRFQELSAKLEQLAFENTTLEPVASELGLEIATTEWFTRAGGPGIASIEAVKQAAFSPEVLQDNENSKPIPASADALVVIRKSEYEAARQQPLEEVRGVIRLILINEGAAKLARETAESLVAEVKAGKSLQSVAQAKNLTVQFDGEATRGQAQLGAEVAAAAFRMARPAAGAVQVDTVASGTGDVAVLALTAVKDPERTDDANAALEESVTRIRDSVAGAEFLAYRKAIEDVVKVKVVNPPNPAAEAVEP
ncbi:MAG: SurA N-terminal domain-containing protein [Panacagrimonas sp.]